MTVFENGPKHFTIRLVFLRDDGGGLILCAIREFIRKEMCELNGLLLHMPKTPECWVHASGCHGEFCSTSTFNDETTLKLEDENGQSVINALKCGRDDLVGIAITTVCSSLSANLR